jgi:predicted HNH restriction endonuclease
MARRKKLIDKVIFKKAAGKCYFCGLAEYGLLDVHRIVPGEEEGQYTHFNSLCLCSNCHRRVHDGQIKIDRKYSTSLGKTILHFWENGVEKWQ